ncbi:hypothetical protein DdX_19070 [Ditylenchus destructor]|uniref:Uncharacterized protein n=1 Tax=Ditylenchus destructor TaxID=166010 RepID=A0AAD4MNT0_9BILA|nr:hypothetical protein DdX_19070 [Ditylenchus destructor]
MYPAKPVPIDSARRDEAIHVSHARIRAPTRNLPFYVTHVTHVSHVSRLKKFNNCTGKKCNGARKCDLCSLAENIKFEEVFTANMVTGELKHFTTGELNRNCSNQPLFSCPAQYFP